MNKKYIAYIVHFFLYIFLYIFILNACSFNKDITKTEDIIYKRTKPSYNPGGKYFHLDEVFSKQYEQYIKKRKKYLKKKSDSEILKYEQYREIDNVDSIEIQRDVDLNNSGWAKYNYISKDGKVFANHKNNFDTQVDTKENLNINNDDISKLDNTKVLSNDTLNDTTEKKENDLIKKIKQLLGYDTSPSAIDEEIEDLILSNQEEKDVLDELEEIL